MDVIAELGSAPQTVGREVSDRLWVLIMAGIPTGVVVAGMGSRFSMFVLRLSSPDNVIGVTSDDGFEIGRFTLGGTYNLLAIGAAVGSCQSFFSWLFRSRFRSCWLRLPCWFRGCLYTGFSTRREAFRWLPVWPFGPCG